MHKWLSYCSLKRLNLPLNWLTGQSKHRQWRHRALFYWSFLPGSAESLFLVRAQDYGATFPTTTLSYGRSKHKETKKCFFSAFFVYIFPICIYKLAITFSILRQPIQNTLTISQNFRRLKYQTNWIIVWNPNFGVFRFLTHLKINVSANQIFGLDFRQCLKFELFGNWTVIECLKFMLVWISDNHCTVGVWNPDVRFSAFSKSVRL